MNFSEVNCQNCQKRFTSVFCKVDHDRLEEISTEKVCTPYQKGQLIFKEGNRPFGVYCINQGKIKLSKMGEDGKEQILRLAKPGDLLGYRSLLSGDKYSASAVALEESAVCFIPKDLFVGILKKDSVLSMEMLKLLSDDLKKAEQQITHLAQKPVRERMAEALLFLKETYGFEKDQQTLDVTLSREELANIVGTATETAIRLLSEFKQDKMIELVGKKIKITNLAHLARTANIVD